MEQMTSMFLRHTYISTNSVNSAASEFVLLASDSSANMRRLILFAFISVFLTKNVTPSKIHKFPSNLAWLFGSGDKSKGSEEESRTVCQSKECKKIAKVISESRDLSVDPCDDFYDYACGKWPKHNPIPEGTDSWSLWHMIQINVNRQIQDILDAGTQESDLLGVKLAKNWYAACMDTDAMDKQGLAPIVSVLLRLGGWPMIMDPDEWDEQEYNWQKIDNQYARLIGRNVFHSIHPNENHSNKTYKVVKIDNPILPIGTYSLLYGSGYNSHEIEKKDPSDNKKQIEELYNNLYNHVTIYNNYIEDGSGDDDNNDSDDDDDDDDVDGSGLDDEHGTEEQDDDSENIKKRKSTTLNHKKDRKMTYAGKRKTDRQIAKKHGSRKKNGRQTIMMNGSHNAKKQNMKKRTIKTKADSTSAQRSIHHKKLNPRKRTLDDTKLYTKIAHKKTTRPRFIIEETRGRNMTLRQQYSDYISKVAQAIAKERGITASKEHVDKDVEDMIDFQLKLAEILTKSGKRLKLTLNDFQEWYHKKESKTTNSKINWIYKITELFDEAGVTINGDLNVEISSPGYLEALVDLLDETSSRTIVNYIHWNFLSTIIKTTTREMRQLYDAWEDRILNKTENESRSDDCIKQAEMSEILSYEYVREHFSDEIAKNAMDMIDDIQKEVEYQIKESEWMDKDTKDFILSKLVNMKKFVGYPNWYRNNTLVKRYYQGLMIGKSYYENTLSYRRYIKWSKLRSLMNDDDDDDDVDDDTIEIWSISPATLNALFMPEENTITITAADFESPFFAYGRPQAINYGIIGFLMAHEVNHGFDDTGHLYDKDGDFMKWLPAMAQAYSKRAECFVEQFDNYPLDKETNLRVEDYGNLTIDDNIADTMGLQAVYRAYLRRERECGRPDATLPGLKDVTNDQLFFLSFANLWCEASNSVITKQEALSDEHSTARLRVIGSVSNSESFAKVYSCPVGSAMNPEKKCSIWK